ncbi:MAG: CPBP family intramembrane metalloprotease [Candidatus Thermoplasmatota archaeon]|nr:CPBP family intramembrane metalloprotease [Candidatus Thermoplasmatota archaeon]
MEGQDNTAMRGHSAPIPPPPPSPAPWQARPAPPPYNPVTDLINMVKSILWSAGFISFLFVILMSFIVVMAMTPEIQQWITTPYPSAANPGTMVLPREGVFVITPWLIVLFTFEGMAFQAWHFLMLGILISAFVAAKHDMLRSWLSSKGKLIKSLTVPEKVTSSLENVAKLYMASISFSILYFIFLAAINVEMNSPDFDSWSRPELIYGLFSASVFEELISRVLLIGIPLAIIGLMKNQKEPFKKLLGGGMDLTKLTFGLIMFSSVIFALAHVGSWDFWKVPQVLVTGMALGWAFVRYGLHASILVHFSINLSSSALKIWPDNLALEGILSVIILIWLVAGAYFLLHYAIELSMKLFPSLRPKSATAGAYVSPPPHWQNYPNQGMGQSAPRSEKPPFPPPPQPPPVPMQRPGGFVCPNCGNTNASYDSGKLTCLKCGTTHNRDAPVEKVEEKKMVEF